MKAHFRVVISVDIRFEDEDGHLGAAHSGATKAQSITVEAHSLSGEAQPVGWRLNL